MSEVTQVSGRRPCLLSPARYGLPPGRALWMWNSDLPGLTVCTKVFTWAAKQPGSRLEQVPQLVQLLPGCPRLVRSEASILGSARCPAPFPCGREALPRARGPGCSPSVTVICMGGSGLFAPQKPVNRPGYGKENCFISDARNWEWEGGRHASKGQMTSRGRALVDSRGWGVGYAETAVISNSHLQSVVRGLTGSICFRYS